MKPKTETETATAGSYIGQAVEAVTTTTNTALVEVDMNAFRSYDEEGYASATYTNLGPTAAITNRIVVTRGKVTSVTNIGP